MRKLFPKVEERDEVVEKGLKLCGADLAVLIGMYPVFTKRMYTSSVLKLVLLFLCLWIAPCHIISLRWAIKAGEIDISLENMAFFVTVETHFAIFVICASRRQLVKEMFRKVGNGFFKYNKPIPSEKLGRIRKFEKLCLYLFRVNNYMTQVGCFVYFVVVPALKVYVTGTYSTVTGKPGSYPYNKNLPVRMPFFFETNTLPTYIIGHNMFFLVVVYSGMMMPMVSNIFLGITLQVCNQLQILRFSLEDIHGRASQLYKERGFLLTQEAYGTEEFKQCLSDCLKENIRHHSQIIKFYRDFELIFSDWSFYQLLASGSIISLTLYNIMQTDTSPDVMTIVAETLGKILLVSLNVLHASIYCMGGQRMTNLSLDLHDAYYFDKWYSNTNRDHRQLIHICLTYSKIPFKLEGYGIIAANAGTLVDILKSAFTLLSFIKFVVG